MVTNLVGASAAPSQMPAVSPHATPSVCKGCEGRDTLPGTILAWVANFSPRCATHPTRADHRSREFQFHGLVKKNQKQNTHRQHQNRHP
jgi:hypothetical protein